MQTFPHLSTVFPALSFTATEAYFLPLHPAPKHTMGTEAPPSYDETVRLIKNLSPEKKEVLHAAVITELKKPGMTDKIIEDVGELAKKAAKIQSLFQEVLVALGQFTYTGVNLKDKWESIYEDFKALLEKSIGEATTASMLIDKFVDTVIPVMKVVKDEDDEKHLKAAINLAQRFLKDCDDTMADAGKTGDPLERIHQIATAESKAFKGFEGNITKFQAEFTQYAEGYTGRVKTQRDIVDGLQANIDSIRTQLMWFGIGMGVTVFAGMIIGPAVIAAAFPVVGALIIGVAVIALGTEIGCYAELNAELKAKEEELKDANNELEKLRTEQAAARDLKSYLADAKGPLLGLVANIHCFGAFWDTIVVDAKKLHKILEDVSKQEPGQFVASGESEFQTYLTRSEAYYRPIQAGLQAYITHDTFANFGK
ncbi:unnamed protein product [Rhizoctonia solani]|uniref:Transmembrane protein n=1 Tax=Rhizoctonia solani TaxID=456999 RepID=A0A8H3GSD2_9AGAM|nr:unnamed protein product [Rhizoctonia solani]